MKDRCRTFWSQTVTSRCLLEHGHTEQHQCESDLSAENAMLRGALERIKHDLETVETCGMCAEGGSCQCAYCEGRNLLRESLKDARAALAKGD